MFSLVMDTTPFFVQERSELEIRCPTRVRLDPGHRLTIGDVTLQAQFYAKAVLVVFVDRNCVKSELTARPESLSLSNRLDLNRHNTR